MRTLLVIAAVIAIAYAGTPSFSICGSGTLLNPQVSTTDNDWSGGKTVTFTVAGDLSAPIESGATIHTEAKFAGSVVEDKTDNLCTYEGTPFVCPTAAGTQSWNFPFSIPSIPFSGKLTSHSDFKNADGSDLLCLELAVEL